MPGPKFRDPAVALPQLYIVAVSQSHGALFGFILVLAEQVNAVEDMAVRPNDERAVLLHFELQGWSLVAICRGTREPSEMRKDQFCSRPGASCLARQPASDVITRPQPDRHAGDSSRKLAADVERKIIELANAVEPMQDGCIHIEKINGPFLYQLKGTPAECKAGLDCAIANGWLWLRESGTYVRFTDARSALFA
jgi:hypothetical protein